MYIFCYVLIFANSFVCLTNMALNLFYFIVRILADSVRIEMKFCH